MTGKNKNGVSHAALDGVSDPDTGKKITANDIQHWHKVQSTNGNSLCSQHFGLFAGRPESRLYNPGTKRRLKPHERGAGILGVTKATRDLMDANGGQTPKRNRWNSPLEEQAIDRDKAISSTLYQEQADSGDSDMETQFDPESDREFDSSTETTDLEMNISLDATVFEANKLLEFLNGLKSKLYDPLLKDQGNCEDSATDNTAAQLSNTR